MSTPLLDVTTNRRDTSVRGLPSGTRVFWRVRKRSMSTVGQWSMISSFTTAQPVSVFAQQPDIGSNTRVIIADNHVRVIDMLFNSATVKVYDLLGAKVASGSVDANDGVVATIRLEDLPRVVLVVVEADDGKRSQHVLLRP